MLAEQLERCEQTLIRGDLRLGNLGFSEDRVVLIDWGERVGSAPPSVELAWFIGFDSYRMEVAPDDVIVEFRRLYRDRFDETALQLSLIGGLVQFGGRDLPLDRQRERRGATALVPLRAVVVGPDRGEALERWSPG